MNSFPGFEEVEDGFCCFWTIDNFSSYKKKLALESLTFAIDKISKSQWFLGLGKSQCDEDYLYIYINKVWPHVNIKYKYSFWLLKTNGWNPVVQHDIASFKAKGYNYVQHKFIKWPVNTDESSEFLINDSLTLAFHVYNDETVSTLDQIFLVSEVVSKNNLRHILETDDFNTYYCSINVPIQSSKRKKDLISTCTQTENVENTDRFDNVGDFLSRIKEDNKFSFVTIRTANKHFVVLKALLCARSPVFNAMFNNNMLENGQNAVDIHDVDSDIISYFIKFLHFEPLDDLKWDESVKLFYVADKYQVETLKKHCVSSLKKTLCEDNLCESFVLADIHDNEDLKQAALEFFHQNLKNILTSDCWKEFMVNHISLAAEILDEFANKL